MRVIDLTMTYHNGMPGLDIVPAKTMGKDGWNASTLRLYSHAGTHMDAPTHFEVSPKTIDQLPAEKCIGKAWVLRLGNLPEKSLLTVDHLSALTEKISPGDSLLIQTGWSLLAGKPSYRDGLPRISEALARFLVKKQVRMLGVEPPSVADVNNLEEVTLIHQILLGGGITIIEGLCNLHQITTEQVTLIALPIKYENGDGAPARVIAIEGEFLPLF